MSVEKFNPYEEGTISHEPKPYTIILNSVAQNCTNLEAFGLWVHFQTMPENWVISPKYIQNKFNIGKDKAYNLLNYLIDTNLLKRLRVTNSDGTHAKTVYVICNGERFCEKKDQPVDNLEPLPDLPEAAEPDAVNPPTTNTNIYTNTNMFNNNSDFEKEKKAFEQNKPYSMKPPSKFWEPGNPDYDRFHEIDHRLATA